jgi:uncharacterized protein (DUF1501 family)
MFDSSEKRVMMHGNSAASWTRRNLLRAGSAGLLSGLAAQFAERSAFAGAQAPEPQASHLIVLWMNGGPSHIDTWDPKSGPTGGRHKAIKTRIANVQISEHLPRLAAMADKLAIIRSLSSKEGNHQRAQYLLHTGYAPNPTVVHPSLGGWLSEHYGGPESGLPAFVSIGGPSFGAGFLGVQHGPFVLAKGGKAPENLGYAQDVDASRFQRRSALLAELEAQSVYAGDAKLLGRRDLYRKTTQLMHSPEVSAFDLSGESEATKAAFGDTDFGRGCLAAVRLVQAGVRVVEVVLDGWDTHQDNFTKTQRLMETLDPAMSALLTELGLRRRPGASGTFAESTLVAYMGDFGRTPRINAAEGRDHYPQASSCVLAGAGIRVGQVYGATDSEGAKVVGDVFSVPDLIATLARPLGLDPGASFPTPSGRPISVTNQGSVATALLRP